MRVSIPNRGRAAQRRYYEAFFATLVVGFAFVWIAACGSTTVNVNTAANSGGNAANRAANTVANAANTVGNAGSAMTVDSPDDFMKEAVRGGMAEVEMGKLAASMATDPEVKRFAQTMVDDHSRANDELKVLAANKNVTLPADLGSHQSDLDELKGLSGANFDRSYVKLMLNDHEKDVEEFQSQADRSADPEVKAFAAKTLPTLKKHLESIQSISNRILR